LLAQQAELELVAAQTRISFTLGATLHTVDGTFKLKRGTIRFDPATGAASGTVVVDATSAESGNKGRDRKLHKEILESASYPEITFTPDRVQGHVALEGRSQVEIHGVFKLHGSEHPMTLAAVVEVAGDQLTATTHFAVSYVEWGLRNPSTFLLRVSGKVDIDIRAVGRLTALSAHQ
jgi:polyisoprenoid-binding protein YceI